MDRRTISDRSRSWLLTEMQAWQEAEILSAEQQTRIVALYESASDVTDRKRSRASFALTSIAAFFVGLATLLLIGYNWEAMPAAVKLVLIFGAIGGTYALAGWLRYSRKMLRASEILFFLGSLFYGCGIWLIGQIFQISGRTPDGLWIWALGIVPIALCLDTLLLHTLVVTLLACWVGTEIIGYGLFINPWIFGRWFSMPAACYSLPLLALPGLLWGYRKRSPETVALYAALIAWWVVLQPVAWHCEFITVYFIGSAGAFFLAFAELHPVGSRMSIPFRLFGVLIVGGLLTVLSFGEALRGLLWNNSIEWYEHGVAAIMIAFAGVATIVIADIARTFQAGAIRVSGVPFAAILRRQWLPVALILLMAGLCLWSGFFGGRSPSTSFGYGFGLDRWSPVILLPTLAVNAVILAFAGWLIHVGLREDRGITFAGGVLLILLWAVCRYVDLFSGVGGMLGASLMFFLCGAALFGMSRFWVKRKEIRHVCDNGDHTGFPFQHKRAHLLVQSRERTILALAVAGQITVLLGMIVMRSVPHLMGQTVLLPVVPVDPRDFFRGDYVILSYEFSRLPAGGIPGLRMASSRDEFAAQQDREIYLSLIPDADGLHYRMGTFSLTPPAGVKYIRGRLTDRNRIEYGIESYFVQEGKGHVYEDAVRNRRLWAEVALAPNGEAALKGLRIENNATSIPASAVAP